MGFLHSYAPGRARKDPFHGVSADYMRSAGCTGCPLQRQGKAHPSGAERPVVYLLGEAPGREEVQADAPFVGSSGRLLRKYIPAAWLPDCRFNNVVMSQPPKNPVTKQQTPPTPVAIAHCSGYLTADIEAAEPTAIFVFGNTPLQALTGQTGITKFAGRRMPVRVGNHTCWLFAFLHPAAILRTEERDREAAEKLFAATLQNAFGRLDALPEPVIHTAAAARDDIRVLDTVPGIMEALNEASFSRHVGLDYETTGLSPYTEGAAILTVAVAPELGPTFAYPLDHPEPGWTAVERNTIHAATARFLQAPVLKIAHNAAFEMLWSLRFFGKQAIRPNHWGDSLAQAFLLDTRPRAHSLDLLCQLHFGLALKSLSNLDVTRLAEADVEAVCRYNAMDAKYCRMVFEKQDAAIAKRGMQPLYRHHMQRIAALVRGQDLGLPVDAAANALLAAQYKARLDKLARKLAQLPEVQAFEKAGQAFNVGSPKHVIGVLRKLGCHLDDTTEETLAAVGTPFTKAVLDWRGTSKVLSTYVTPLAHDSKLVHRGLLHPVIATTHTRTWRTASEEPNIQNFPKRDETHRGIRGQIVALPGHVLLSVDYSGIQARNVAMESKDRRLVQAFIDRYDIHQDWSERIQRAAPRWAAKRSPKELRSVAKNKLVFPLFFGAQPNSVAHYLGVDTEIGFKLFEAFWGEFPEIRKWHARLRSFYKRKHYVTGLSGFRRPAPISDNQLINTPIQSDEALLVCEAMTRLSQYEDDALQPVAMIHDDLTFMLPIERFDECVDIILTEMLRTEHIWINVPLAVEVAAGPNWAEQQEIGKFESDGVGGYAELP